MQESKPKKSLGQHWLYDDSALTAIADAAAVGEGDIVLEIGPGLGTLTAKLLGRGANVTAVEYDSDLASNLLKNIQEHNTSHSKTRSWNEGKLRVINEDILDFDFTEMPKGYKVVANIPYYLTSNLIRRMCESPNPFTVAALLIQKEVAQRVCAVPGQTSLLSISTQFYCHVSLGPVVPAEMFTPPPKVDSQVLLLEFRKQPLFPGIDTKKFFSLVKAGFSERRKKLRSSLSGGLGISKAEADGLLKKAGISGDLRAQNLSLEQWHDLYQALT